MDAAQLIRDTRHRHRLDQRDLARRCRTSQTYISRVERGEVSPTVHALGKLLQAMGEQLDLRSAPGPAGNQSVEELRADFIRLSPEERIAQAAELSFALTALARVAKDRS
jgi:transcriptional regulator with XRE-family HTH domain